MAPPIIRALALTLSIAGFTAPSFAQEGPAVVALEACVDRTTVAVQKRYEGVSDVSARFQQTTRAVGVGIAAGPAQVSRGRVVLAKPGKMRWTYEEPERSLVVSDGETLWLYDPDFGEAQKLPAGGGYLSGAAAQFLLGAGDMRRDFEVSAVACGAETVELQLVPREPASYEKLYLDVHPATGDVRATRVVDLLGNVVNVAFEEMRFNTSPPASEFRFVAPEGVRVIELAP
jgi:outer membrane lipoprotein carrier protein